MRYKVVDDFQTETRKFHPDMEIDVSEIDGAASVERWVEMGKLKPAPDLKPDLASDQASLRAAWRASPEFGEGHPVYIADQELYGTLRSPLDGQTADVHVFGEEALRRYPVLAVDVPTRSVRGSYVEQHLSRRAQTALTTEARVRVNAPEVTAASSAGEPSPAA